MCLEQLGPMAPFEGSGSSRPSLLSPAQADDGGGDETDVIITITTES